ncbi:Blast:Cadherin-86C [Gryllus bimaculatus]|nr:Blast:Cadherin-86C [Gryllus bimaculatus]
MVEAEVYYVDKGVVDLSDLQAVNGTLINAGGVKKTETYQRADSLIVFWILIVLAIIIVIAIIVLILCCLCAGCPLYVSPRCLCTMVRRLCIVCYCVRTPPGSARASRRKTTCTS